LVRTAREARGQTLTHLSILLKITERRLQAFEEGRWADVGDNTFVRALGQSLCRHLELDPSAILQSLPASHTEPRQQPTRARLPESTAPALKSLRAPVRLPGRTVGGEIFTPVRLAVAVILLGALALLVVPASWWEGSSTPPVAVAPQPASAEAPAPAAPPASEPATVVDAAVPATAAPSPVAVAGSAMPIVPVTTAPTAATTPPAAQSAANAAPSPVPNQVVSPTPNTALNPAPDFAKAPLQVKATRDTWVQVTDARGQIVFSRLLRTGEQAGVEGQRPLRLRVGNVAGTEAVWQGRPVPLQEQQRNNVADVELP
jgi:cytoskeleton protein RodZ